jgi:DNA-binding MarR family transcriptional regulator
MPRSWAPTSCSWNPSACFSIRLNSNCAPRGGISYVQFERLARLASVRGPLTMTELADGVVYSRSGLTYQAGLLERADLITRGPSPDDDRATLVTITGAGLALFDRLALRRGGAYRPHPS